MILPSIYFTKSFSQVSRQLVDALVAGERIEAGPLPPTEGAGANTSSGDLPSSCQNLHSLRSHQGLQDQMHHLPLILFP